MTTDPPGRVLLVAAGATVVLVVISGPGRLRREALGARPQTDAGRSSSEPSSEFGEARWTKLYAGGQGGAAGQSWVLQLRALLRGLSTQWRTWDYARALGGGRVGHSPSLMATSSSLYWDVRHRDGDGAMIVRAGRREALQGGWARGGEPARRAVQGLGDRASWSTSTRCKQVDGADGRSWAPTAGASGTPRPVS